MIYDSKQKYNEVHTWDLDMFEDDVLCLRSLTLGFFWLITQGACRGEATIDGVDGPCC